MSYGEMGFLALVLTGFASFIGGVGFVSIWSRRPAKATTATSAVATASAPLQAFKRAA